MAEEQPIQKVKQESRGDYLKAIYMFSRMSDGAIRSSELAEYMGYSKASVCRMMGIMKKEGLLTIGEDFGIRLTEEGESEAREVYAKYCFFEKLLTAAGIKQDVACEEACRMEHMLSDDSFIKLRDFFKACTAVEN